MNGLYQALYRKWRPRTFDDVVGQDHITSTLRKQVESGRLSHAYLFIGTRGTGKTTCAKILARAVNCEHPVNGSPCNECAACRGIESGSILDVVELDAASNNRVDDVRALQDEAVFSPAGVKKRVYIIDEVHMLSTAAFNALLKILEEPPEHLLFILCTTELHKVLPTIVSRCQRHSFKRITPSAISERLLYVAGQEGMTLSSDAADMLARLSDGGMRDALSLLDQCSAADTIDTRAVLSAMGMAGVRATAELLQAVCRHDTAAALRLFDSLWREGKDPSVVLDELGGLIRDVLLTIVAPDGCEGLLSGSYARNTLSFFAKHTAPAELMRYLHVIHAADLTGVNPKRAAELCLVTLSAPDTDPNPSALEARLSLVEERLRSGFVPRTQTAEPDVMPAEWDLPAPVPPVRETSPSASPAAESAPPAVEQPSAEAAPRADPVMERPPFDAAPAAEPPAQPREMPSEAEELAPPLPPEPPEEDFFPPLSEQPPLPDAPPDTSPEPFHLPWDAAPAAEPAPPVEPTSAAPDPAPAPPVKPAPAAPAAAPADTDGLFERILSAALPKMTLVDRMLFSSPPQAGGRVEGTELRLTAYNPFAKGQLSMPDLSDIFREAASAVCGQTMTVRVVLENRTAPVNQQAIEDLGNRFSNFTIQ